MTSAVRSAVWQVIKQAEMQAKPLYYCDRARFYEELAQCFADEANHWAQAEEKEEIPPN